MRRAYLICPECKKVTEFVDTVKARVGIRAFPCDGEICYKEEDLIEEECEETCCENCKAVFINYRAEDFAVVIENGKVEEVGDYWLGEEDKIAEILKKEKLL